MAITVLFSSAGRRNQLIECFRMDAQELNVELVVICVDAAPQLSSACHAANKFFHVPRVEQGGFVDALLAICKSEAVDILVPTIDTELAILSENVARFEQLGTRVLVSTPEVVALARDKHATASFLSRIGVPSPSTYLLEEVRKDPNLLAWPVIVKPTSGSASVGVVYCDKWEDLPPASQRNMIAQQRWFGQEFTVNCFRSTDGKLVTAVPHVRLEVRAGEVSKARTVRHEGLLSVADRISEALPGLVGPYCFQAIITADHAIGVIEVNARFGGGYPLAHRAGARFSRWILEEGLRRRPTYCSNWRSDLTMLRFDSAVFVGH